MPNVRDRDGSGVIEKTRIFVANWAVKFSTKCRSIENIEKVQSNRRS